MMNISLLKFKYVNAVMKYHWVYISNVFRVDKPNLFRYMGNGLAVDAMNV